MYIDSLPSKNGMKNMYNKHLNKNRRFKNEVLNSFVYAVQKRNFNKLVLVTGSHSL